MSISGLLKHDILDKLTNTKFDINEVRQLLANLKKQTLISTINPVVFKNRSEEIKTMAELLEDSTQKLILVGGIHGTGKSTLMRIIGLLCAASTMFYSYECSSITNLDDIVLSLCGFMDRKLNKPPQSTKDLLFKSVDEKLMWYLKNLDRSLIIVLDSFEYLVSPKLIIENDELKNFLSYLLENPKIKLILVGQKLPTEDLESSQDFISNMRLSGLNEEESIYLLKYTGINANKNQLIEIYNFSRGYPWLLLLCSKLVNSFNKPLDEIIGDSSKYDASFESYLINTIYLKLTDREKNALNYLSVFRHSINIETLNNFKSLSVNLQETIDYLINLLFISKTARRYYLNSTIKKFVYNTMSLESKYTIHKLVSEFYAKEVSGKLANRTLRLSRKLLHSEQLYHNMTANKLYSNKDIINKSQQERNLQHIVTDFKTETSPISNIEIQNFIINDVSDQTLNNSRSTEDLELNLTPEEIELLKDKSIDIQKDIDTNIFDDINTENLFKVTNIVPHDNESAKSMADSLTFVASTYASQDKYEIAIDRYKEAMEIYQNINDLDSQLKTTIKLGESFLQIKNYELAIESYNKALIMCDTVNDYTDMPLIIACMGKVYSECYEHDKALSCFNKVLKMPQEEISNSIIANVYLWIAEIYNYRSDLEQAITYYNNALKYYEHINDVSSMATVYSHMGLIYDDENNYDNAITYYKKSLDYCKKSNKMAEYASTLSNMADIYYEHSQFSNALNCYKQSLVIDRSFNNYEGLYKTLSKIGSVYCDIGNTDKALKYYYQELKVAKKFNEPYATAMACLDLGDLYFTTKNYEKAAEFFYLSELKIGSSISTDSHEKIERRILKLQDYLTEESLQRIKQHVLSLNYNE